MTVRLGYKQTDLGEIPDRWSVVKLRDVVREFRNGFASGERDQQGIVQIRMNNVTTDGRLVLDTYLKVPVQEDMEGYLLRQGDILFNNTNSIDLVGKTAVFEHAPFPCTFSNHFTRIRADENKALPKWILYYLIVLWNRGYFQSIAIRHVGQSAVHMDEMFRVRIPLPPLAEQRKIVSILSEVENAIEKTEKIITKTQQLKKGLMQQLLTKGLGHTTFKESTIGLVPEEWEIVPIARFGEVVTGSTPSTDVLDYYGSDYPFVSPADMGASKEICSTRKRLTKKGLDAVRCIPERSVLVTCISSIDGIGKVGMSSTTCATNQQINSIICSEDTDPDFLYYCIDFARMRIQAYSARSSGHFAIIPKEIFSQVPMPHPSKSEQTKIGTMLSSVDLKIENELSYLEALGMLKSGLMQALLTGEVRVKVT